MQPSNDEQQVNIYFPWRALLLFATWWVVLQGFALLSHNRFQLTEPDNAYTWTSQIKGLLPIAWKGFADFHARFDSGFYTWIAGQGYNKQNAAFLPLYPILIKLGVLAWCAPQGPVSPTCDYASVAFVLSNLSALGAALVIYLLSRIDLDEAHAQQALFYFLIFPTAFFLSANYSESLFVFLAALSFYAARRQHWAAAGIIGALAMLTRVVGLGLFAALLVEWLTQRRGRGWGWLLLMPLAFVGFELYLNLQGLSFFATEQALFYRTPFNFESLPQNLDWEHLQTHPAAQINFALDIGLALFVVIVSLVGLAQGRFGYGVFGILCILLPLASGQTLGLSRFALAAFTAPLTLAHYGHHAWLDRAYTLSATLLLALYTILFTQGYWAG